MCINPIGWIVSAHSSGERKLAIPDVGPIQQNDIAVVSHSRVHGSNSSIGHHNLP
jgi:hypothetical protein